jgi:hypothetical protein
VKRWRCIEVDVMLTRNQLDALAECARYQRQRRDYWWRIASMKRLAELGLVEECHPEFAALGGYRGKKSCYRPTQAGIKFMAGAPAVERAPC